ncbi:MAG: hypothetical protein IKW99_00750 [Bacteroidales bacterium]|nr:hypothetical protein [Bacteroidales bacterium]
MLRHTFLFLSLAAALFVACRSEKVDTLKTGDLVFVGIPLDYSLDNGSMDAAIASSTGSPDSLNLIHVAIAEVDAEGEWIIDATIKRGIDRHPLDTFITDFTLKDGSLPVFIVKRLKDPSKASEYVSNTRKYLGRPYDLHFNTTDDSLYCSELVRDCYVDPDGEYIFETVPMNFKDADGEFPLYWKQLFELLQSPIPQDLPGTNPQQMSQSPALVSTKVDLLRR